MNIFQKIAPLAGALSLLCPTTFAGTNTWTQNGPEGGFTSSVVVSPADPDIMLAAAIGSVYRSTNGGTSWTRTPGTPAYTPTRLVFDPAHPGRVVGGGVRLLLSEDAGQTFSLYPEAQLPEDLSTWDVQFNSDGSYLFVTTLTSRIFRTSDLGLHWVEVTGSWPQGSSSVDLTLATAPGAPNTLYVGVKGVGVFRSTNAGDDWTPTATGPSAGAYAPLQVVVQPGDPDRVITTGFDGLWLSPDGGASWGQIIMGTVYSAAFDPADASHVIAVSNGGEIWRSTNDGDSFTSGGLPLAGYFNPVRLTYSGSRLWIASADGPLSSDDDGAHFVPKTSGMIASSIKAFSVSDEGVAYAAFNLGPFGVYRRDGGHWTRVNDASLRDGVGAFLMNDVAVAPQDSNVVYANIGLDSLLRSDDGGVTWTMAGAPLSPGLRGLTRIAVDPSDSQIAYVGSQTDGVWKTENGGQQWEKHWSGPLPSFVSSLSIDRANPQIVYAATQFYGTTAVFKTVDGGASWAPTGASPDGLSATFVAIDPSNSAVLYTSFGTLTYKSTNAGATWTALSTSQYLNSISIDPLYPQTLIGGKGSSYGGFARSVDGGATWEEVNWNLSMANGFGMTALIADPSHPGRVFSGAPAAGIFEYDIANDLSVEIEALGTPAPGATFNATVTVRNAGPLAASPSEVTVAWPAFLQADPPTECAASGASAICAVPALANLGEHQIVIPLTASTTAASGALTAQVEGHESELDAGNNSASKSIDSGKKADLGISIADGNRVVDVNGAISLSFTVSNAGPDSAISSQVSIAVPAGLSFTTATNSAGSCGGAGTGTITCDLTSPFVNGATANIALAGTAVTAGSATVSIEVRGDVPDTTTANDSATAQFTVNTPVVTPPPSSGSGGGGKKKGGGSFDLLAAALLGLALALRVGRRRAWPVMQ